MMAVVRCLILVLALPLMGCSGSVALPRAADIKILGQAPTPPRPRNVLYRDEVDAAVKAGLGWFLQKIDLRATVRKDDLGRDVFAGFEIVAMRPAAAWFDFDFAPGDVITRVNGVSVEHYNAMLPVFESLPEANALEIALVRGGAPTVIQVRIEPRSNPSSAPAPASAPASAALPAKPPGDVPSK